MSVWMSMKAALTVMDMVTRSWARQLQIDECGVMVLMQLGVRQRRSAAKLALYCGRPRQQVQRSLAILQAAGMVEAATVSARGCTTSWTLTEKGQRRWKSLQRAVRAWEESFERAIDLPLLSQMLGRVAEASVNRPGADGWRKGLIQPHELKIVPLWFQVEMEDELLARAPVPPVPADEDEERAERERERGKREWGAMWMRLSS